MSNFLSYDIKATKREVWDIEFLNKKFYVWAEPNETKEEMLKRIGLLLESTTISSKIDSAESEIPYGSKYYSVLDSYGVSLVAPEAKPPVAMAHPVDDDDVRCPKCGSRARIQGVSTTTLAYYPPIYDENGVNTNPDRNETSTSWECFKCGEKYTTKE